MLIIMGYL